VPFRAGFHHWRISQGAEVDLVLEQTTDGLSVWRPEPPTLSTRTISRAS
jgi:hypothetical protein